MLRLRSMARDNKGQELVEYALTLPILLLLVLGIMEFAVAILSYNTIANAAREGARVGAVMDGEIEAIEKSIEDAVRARTVFLADHNISVTEDVVTVSDNPHIEEYAIQVTVNYTHPLISGFIMQAAGGNAELYLRSEAQMRRESPLRATPTP